MKSKTADRKKMVDGNRKAITLLILKEKGLVSL